MLRAARGLIGALAPLAVAAADPYSWSGQVRDEAGEPLAGIFVTVRAEQGGIETTSFTDAGGRFTVSSAQPGAHALTVHQARYESLRLDAGTLASAGKLALTLKPATTPTAGAHTAAWFAHVPDSPEKREFLLNCASCHEISAGRIHKDGKLRDRAGWIAGIAMMKALDAYAVIPPDFDTEHYAEWLASQFTPEKVARVQAQGPASPALAEEGVVFTEYPIPVPTELPHDLVLGPDHRIWVTGFWTSEIWALEATNGHWEHFGVNAEADTVAQVRALEFDRHGDLWVVNGGTSSVVRLDPASRHFDTFKVGMYPHDLVLDSQGNAWVNDYFAKQERIARVDAQRGTVEVIPLPSRPRPASEGVPLSYGLQVDAADRLWSTQLAANTLARHDIATGQSKLYEMPDANTGPRRTAVGPDGRIWIPEFNTGRLTCFDPETETFSSFDTGIGAAGIYDVAVDPKTGEVWLGAALASALLRFDPQARTFTEYPLPTEPAYMRHLAVDAETGDVWTSYSSLPTASPKVVRLARAATARGPRR